MSRQLKRALLVAALAIPLSELGHVISYGARVPSVGPHGYFPTLLQFAGSIVGAALLASLAVVAMARLLAGGTARSRPWSFPLLFAALFTAQLVVFMLQEGLESHSWPRLATLGVGLLGQQPVAFVAALALRWLSARLGPAARALSSSSPVRLALRPALRLDVPPGPAWQPRLAAARVRARGQRAPPL